MKVIFSLLFLLIISCNSNPELKTTKYPSGKVSSEVYYIQDTIKQGLAKYYSTNGKIQDEVQYENGKRNGLHKHYDINGNLECVLELKDNMKNGAGTWYYPDGKLQSKSYWINNKGYGSSYFYYQDGKIEHYQCKDFFGTALYLIKWNENGEKIQEEGVVFSPDFYINPSDTNNIHINDTITIKITVAEPPIYQTKIWVKELERGMIQRRELPIENSTAIIDKVFKNDGKYSFKVIGEIRDLSGNLVLADSLEKILDVKKN